GRSLLGDPHEMHAVWRAEGPGPGPGLERDDRAGEVGAEETREVALGLGREVPTGGKGIAEARRLRGSHRLAAQPGEQHARVVLGRGAAPVACEEHVPEAHAGRLEVILAVSIE